jgi:hypothetical protein
MSLITIQDSSVRDPVSGSRDEATAGRWYCQQLEEGHILFFPQTPFELAEDEREFLLSQRQVGAGYHKNIAYRPNQDRLTGFVKHSKEETERLRSILRAFSQRVEQCLATLLPPYAASWRLDYASFRPQEEQGRDLRLRSRNDLLHVDAFPTRPTNGDRILRVFTNINPTQPRCWITSETFDVIVTRFAGSPGLRLPECPETSPWQRARHSMAKLARSAGLPVVRRSPYDQFMLRFHHYLKEHQEFQTTCPKHQVEFPPQSTWIVFTDLVTHAALSGQYALEQTLIVPREAMVWPEKAPVSVLERLVGSPLTLRGQDQPSSVHSDR